MIQTLMNWKSFWNRRANNTNAHEQVGRRGGDDAMIIRIAAHIAEVTPIKKEDKVLDVCCGNGMLTGALSAYCLTIEGIDFSENLIDLARKQFPALKFQTMNALHTDAERLNAPYDCIVLYFSFQYFESLGEGEKLLKNLLGLLRPGGKILLGDIPERRHFFRYYHSFRRLATRLVQQFKGSNDMGKFWSENELNIISRKLGVKGKRLTQPSDLPYAHYRMDYLITYCAIKID